MSGSDKNNNLLQLYKPKIESNVNEKIEIISNITIPNNSSLEMLVIDNKNTNKQITFETIKEDKNYLIKYKEGILYSPIKHEIKNMEILNSIINDLKTKEFLTGEQIIQIYRNIIPIIKFININIFEEKYLIKLKYNTINQGKYFNSAFNILQQNIINLIDSLNKNNEEERKEDIQIIKIISELILLTYYNKKPTETLSIFIYLIFKIDYNIFNNEFQTDISLEMASIKIKILNYKIYKEIIECKEYIEKTNNKKLIKEFNELNIFIDEENTFYINFTEDMFCIKNLKKFKINNIIEDNSLINKLENLNLKDFYSKILLIKSIKQKIIINLKTINLFNTEILKESYFDKLEVTNNLYEENIKKIKTQLIDLSLIDTYEFISEKKIEICQFIFDELLLNDVIKFIIMNPINNYEKLKYYDPKIKIFFKILNEFNFNIQRSFTEILSCLLPEQINMLEIKLLNNLELLYKLKNKQIENILYSFNKNNFNYEIVFKFHFNTKEKIKSFENFLLNLIENKKPINIEIYQIFIHLFPLFEIPNFKNILIILFNEMKLKCFHVLKELNNEITFNENLTDTNLLENEYKKVSKFICSSINCEIYTIFLLIRYFIFKEIKLLLNSNQIIEFRRFFYYFNSSLICGISFNDVIIKYIIKKIKSINEFRDNKFKFKLGDKPKKVETFNPNKLMSFMDRLLFINNNIKLNVEREDLILLNWRDYIELMEFISNKIDYEKFKELFFKCPVKSIKNKVFK